MKILFMGTPEFALPSLEHLVLNRYQVVAVYTQPDKTAGRGRTLISSPVKKTAIKYDIPIIQPVNFKKTETVNELAELNPDIIVVAAYGQILPQSVLDIPARGCLNIHPSLLPRYRGTSPVAAAILSGDSFAGVTIMLMEAGLDTGPVLLQAQTAISSVDTTGSLTEKLSLVSAHLLLETLPRWTSGELLPRPQDDSKSSHTSLLSKQEGEIDWRLPAEDIWRRVRAYLPWPGCYTIWQGKQIKILQAIHLPGRKDVKPGQVVALEHPVAEVGVGTGNGILGIVKLQLEGKKAISSPEFIRGNRNLVGAVLPSD